MRRELHLEEQPVAKGRPRCAGNRAVTPAKTRDAERVIGWRWKEQYGDDPLSGPLNVELEFHESIGQRPQDLDNLVKLVLDALNGVAWGDDAQVAKLSARVYRRSIWPRVSIAVEQIPWRRFEHLDEEGHVIAASDSYLDGRGQP